MSKQQDIRGSFDLLALPWPALTAMVKCLESKDKLSLMAVCRPLLDVVLATTPVRLLINHATKYKGMAKALPSATSAILIIQSPGHQQATGDALDKFLGFDDSMLAGDGLPSFAGVRECFIVLGGELRCLVPEFIARTCPNITNLCVINAEGLEELRIGSAPIHLCTSLHTLTVQGTRQEPYQPIPCTAAELSSKLPNIKYLAINGFNTPPAMIEAWGEQLERLNTDIAVENGTPTPSIQACVNVERLWLTLTDNLPLLPLPITAQHLTNLTIEGTWLSKQHMKQVMQLPNLTTLKVSGIENLDEDLRQHACCWQLETLTVTGGSFAFVCLGQVPFQGLKKLEFHDVVTIYLPDGHDRRNLEAVQASVSNTPNLTEVVVLPLPNANPDSTVVILSPATDEEGYIDEFRLGCMIVDATPRLPKAHLCDITELVGPSPVVAVTRWAETGIRSLAIPTEWVFDRIGLTAMARMKDLESVEVDYIEGSQAGLPEEQDQIITSATQGKAMRVAMALSFIAREFVHKLALMTGQPLVLYCNWPCPVGTVSELFGTSATETGDENKQLDQSAVASQISMHFQALMQNILAETQCTYCATDERWSIHIKPIIPPEVQQARQRAQQSIAELAMI